MNLSEVVNVVNNILEISQIKLIYLFLFFFPLDINFRTKTHLLINSSKSIIWLLQVLHIEISKLIVNGMHFHECITILVLPKLFTMNSYNINYLLILSSIFTSFFPINVH